VIAPVAREQNTAMPPQSMPCASPVELIDGCVDDHTVEEDGIEGFMVRVYNGPKAGVDIPLLARRRILTVY